MNPFLLLMSLFIFLVMLMYIKIIDVYTGNFIFQKIIIFSAIFVFSLILNLITNSCHLSFTTLINGSLAIGLMAIVGYSVLIDLQLLPGTSEYFLGLRESGIFFPMVSSAIIIIVVGISKFMELSMAGTTCNVPVK